MNEYRIVLKVQRADGDTIRVASSNVLSLLEIDSRLTMLRNALIEAHLPGVDAVIEARVGWVEQDL